MNPIGLAAWIERTSPRTGVSHTRLAGRIMRHWAERWAWEEKTMSTIQLSQTRVHNNESKQKYSAKSYTKTGKQRRQGQKGL